MPTSISIMGKTITAKRQLILRPITNIEKSNLWYQKREFEGKAPNRIKFVDSLQNLKKLENLKFNFLLLIIFTDLTFTLRR